MKIKEIRKQLGLTQTDFGNLFGIPMRTIQEWENERRTPPQYIINLIEENLKHRGLLKDEADK